MPENPKEPALLDCRGLACPHPVLRTKEALETSPDAPLTVLVDAPASRENVSRFAASRGAAVEVTEEPGGGWRLRIVPGCACENPGTTAEPPTAFLITSDRLGADPELGKILMRALLSTLPQAATRPARLVFLNRGVHLTTDGSEVLDVLRELETSGVEVLSCGTCLEFFGKKGALAVGRVSNMYETVEMLTGAYRVATLS